MKAAADKRKREAEGEEDPASIAYDFTAIELYRELVREKQGEKATTPA